MITDTELFVQLERLAQAFPWNDVDIWLRRAHEGEVTFTAYVSAKESFGQTDSVFGRGHTAEYAVDEAVKEALRYDPERARVAAIQALKDKIAKLEQVVIGLPPYVPNREICDRNPDLQGWNPKARATTTDV